MGFPKWQCNWVSERMNRHPVEEKEARKKLMRLTSLRILSVSKTP